MNNFKKIKLKDIDSFKNHPYKVEKDESIQELANSIKENGLINPLIVRQKENGRYELISGHRRKLALELNGEKETEVNIKDLTDDEAIIFMVDSNMQREKILPSEKAYAYKMKYDALKHQGKKTSGPEVQKLDEDSDRNIRRYLRLTYLIPELLELVDNTVKYDGRTTLTMGIKPAVEISYLSKENQRLLYEAIDYNQATPSHAQSIKIRNMEKDNKLNEDTLDSILNEEKGNQHDQIAFNKDKLVSVLPPELLKRDKRYVEQYIVDAISFYSKSKNIERGDAYDLDM